jgi:hypothetical protein
MKKRNAIILLLLAGILAFRCDPEGPDTEQYIKGIERLEIHPWPSGRSRTLFNWAIPFGSRPTSPTAFRIFTPVSGSISARVLSFLT